MAITITVKKIELISKLVLTAELERLSKNVTSNEHTISFVPTSGNVTEFLHILRENQIPYDTISHTTEGTSS